MKKKTSPKVIGAGSPILDILVKVDDDFVENRAGGAKGGSKMIPSREFDEIINQLSSEKKIAPGGSAANTIFALARLGMQTGFIGAVGNDEYGKFYLENYRKYGGDSNRIRIRKEFPTGRCLCMITPDTQRTMRTDLGAAISLKPEEIVDADFDGFDHLHMEGYLLFNKPLGIKILQKALDCGLSISLDLSSFELVKYLGDELPELLAEYVDIVFANEDEADAFSGEKDPKKALRKLAELCDLAVVKLGAEGALIYAEKSIHKISAIRVNALDTTGAGDLWAAGFLYGLLTGADIQKSGYYGAILGAEVVQIFGANIPEDRWTKIIEKLS